ncbi:MAG: LuxR C-terminal-related transcriptional regulator [Hyphomicrobium sp.]|uniref:LuxR C-terminal-related transcriptional regulator n=1 Tax=Hyphomicrobium sp. TaxID=82 RepID=UPI0025BD8F15|nr:LuxR C-terminal-related transcriptional regulator [Hyphomicrobium sp.]MBZ0211340.1 LuxR C-terminal-related transcriptional regulator [Hyphomicrobium sp.]
MSVMGLTQDFGHPVLVDLPRIALTKTVPPAVRKFAVQRPELMKFLDGAAARRVILFRAPAGYGKTIIAAEWSQRLREAGSLVAWLSLDSDDNEPGAFAYHLARAFESAATNLGREAIELLQASNLIPARNVISSLLNAVAETDCETYLFLDDFHVVSDARCHELMKMLVRYAPSTLHLVLISRTEPRFSLSRLRLEDELVEIDVPLLKFKPQEICDFLGDALCHRLGKAGIAKLHATTEGWPAALQLSRIALTNSADPVAHVRTISGTSRTISEYFEDTLATEPEEVVDFLLKTSILEQMNGSLCSAVAGTSEEAAILEALEREQFLLVPLDESGNWYRYHNLLREFLLDRLRTRMGDQLQDLHRRACRWYAARQMWSEAVHYAIAAGDYPLALEFIENCAMSMVARGDLLTLLSWEQQLPKELMSGQLEVKLALAWGMSLVTRFKEAEVLLTQVEAGTHAALGSDLWWRCRAARAVFCALTEDSARGRDIALECLAGYKFDAFNFNALCNVVRYAYLKSGDWKAFYAVPNPDPSAGEASYVLPENYRLCLYGLAAVKQLRFDEAFDFYAVAQSLAEKYAGAKSVSASMLTALIARLEYERGDVTGAEVRVLDALELIETTAFHEGFRNAFFVLVRAAAVRGDYTRAMSLLNRAERLSWERGWGVVVAMLLVERTRLLLANGNVSEALALMPAFDELHAKHAADLGASIRTWRLVAKGLIDAASENLEDAAAALSEAFSGLLSTDDRFIALRVGIDLAVLYDRLGFLAKSHALLKKLMAWGAEANMPSFVLDHERRIVPILLKARDAAVFDGDDLAIRFVNGLLLQLRERLQAMRKSAAARPPDELTARERTIVEFIARGRSNKEIARELGVAPETIKTHLKRIFQKLSAESRAQAVVRAQSLGMLKTGAAQAAL